MEKKPILNKSTEQLKQEAAHRLNEILLLLDTTVVDFAANLGYGDNKSTVYNVSNARTLPNYDLMRRITLVYPQINIEWFNTGIGKPLKNENAPLNAPNYAPLDTDFNENLTENPFIKHLLNEIEHLRIDNAQKTEQINTLVNTNANLVDKVEQPSVKVNDVQKRKADTA